MGHRRQSGGDVKPKSLRIQLQPDGEGDESLITPWEGHKIRFHSRGYLVNSSVEITI